MVNGFCPSFSYSFHFVDVSVLCSVTSTLPLIMGIISCARFATKTPCAFWIRVESSLPHTSIRQIKCFSFGEVTAFNQINVVLYGTIK